MNWMIVVGLLLLFLASPPGLLLVVQPMTVHKMIRQINGSVNVVFMCMDYNSLINHFGLRTCETITEAAGHERPVKL